MKHRRKETIKKLAVYFVKVNGILGIGSVILSVIVIILGEIIPKESTWKYPVIIAIIAVIWLIMVILNYIVSINRKIPLKIDTHKICELLLENVELISKICHGVTTDDEQLFCLVMLNNLESVKKYCFANPNSKDIVVRQIILQVDFLDKRSHIMDNDNQIKLRNLKLQLTPYYETIKI